MIAKALENRIVPNSILVTDSKNSYDRFAEDNNLQQVKIPSGMHKKYGYTINGVNEIMSEIETYLYRKR